MPSTPARPLPILTRPWFWILFIGALWLVPLVKSFGAELPEPLPGHDGEPLVLELRELDGRAVSIQDLAGYLLIVSELPMGDARSAEQAIQDWRELKGRLRGLGSAVVHVQIAPESSAEALSELIRVKRARKPNNVFLLDPSGAALRTLVEARGLPSGDLFLVDTHGRWRGSYPQAPAGIDQLVHDAGHLANWPGSDPALGAGIKGS